MKDAPRITVVGLGPAGPELVTAAALDAIDRIPARYLRTVRHPSATVVRERQGVMTFDDAYEEEPDFDAVYRRIADALFTAAAERGEILYAVPGSPAVLERTVDLLRSEAPSRGVHLEIIPGLSFLDLAWARLGIDPLDKGVRLVDGHRFADRAAGERGPLLVAHCHNGRVLSDVKLALDLDGPPVTVLQRLGLADERVFDVDRAELDRAVEADHLTSLWIAEAAAPVASEVARFDELVRLLRQRCPWDREQTHQSLTRHLLEETYEVLEAIAAVDPDTGDGYDHLEEELGDLLFQVVFHAALAAEQGAFTLADVARGIHDKLVARHPHVFGDVDATTPGAVIANWEAIKKAEKGRSSAFDGIPRALPGLAYAAKVLRKSAGLGIDVPAAATVTTAGDVGDALLAVVAAARTLDVDPEDALRAAANELRTRAEATE